MEKKILKKDINRLLECIGFKKDAYNEYDELYDYFNSSDDIGIYYSKSKMIEMYDNFGILDTMNYINFYNYIKVRYKKEIKEYRMNIIKKLLK